MTSAFTVGAEFVLGDKFSPELRRLVEGLEGANRLTTELQGKFDRLGLGSATTRFRADLAKMVEATDSATASMLKAFGGIDGAIDTSIGTVGKLTKAITGDLTDAAKVGSGELVTGFANVDKALGSSAAEVGKLASSMTADLVRAASTSTADVVAGFGRIDASIGTATASLRAMQVQMTSMAGQMAAMHGVPSVGGGSPSLPGSGRPHTRPGGRHSGVHLNAPGMHIPGGHLGFAQGSDGMVPLVGGLAIGDILKHGVEHGFDFDHFVAQYEANGFTAAQIDEAKKAAWANAANNPNASATDSLKNILELNKATGDLHESIGLLPAFSTAETAMQSIKAENLHSRFNAGTQVLNFAKGLEEMGVTQKGDSEEDRAANVQLYTKELLRTMVSSRGLFDGNALFALTNNSGGAAQNWDMRMGTVVAPILGDIMKHSKFGNADYMALKSYVGGGITPKATAALVKYGLADADKDTYTDKTGIHLNANSSFAEGASDNVFDWSRGLLNKLEAHGVNIHDQKEINKVVNEIGSNKSTTMMMRALLEPGTRGQIVKEMALRDRVPDDAAGILQNKDPVLKLDALHKKLDDFFTALGGPLVDPAIAGLTKLTSGINALAQFMQAHPDIAKFGEEMAAVAAAVLVLQGATKMLGITIGAANTAAHASAVPGSVPAIPGPTGPAKPGVGSLWWPYAIYQGGKDAIDSMLGWTAENQKTLDRATSGAATWERLQGLFGVGSAEAATLPRSLSPVYTAPNHDGNALHRNDEMPAAKVGEKLGMLSDKTGFVLTSFEGLKTNTIALNDNFTGLGTGSGAFKNALDILTATAIGAARALAEVAMSGGNSVGGGSGFINASYGGGGGFGGTGGSPDISGAFRGSGPGIGHFFSAADREKNIRAYAASIGINPDVAMAVAKSEGFGRFDGDRGTSFGDLQMHIGGGLGDFYRRATGKNPADPKNELELDRFALDQAKRGGWSPWHGAARIGVHGRYGIGETPVAGAPPSRTVAPGKPAADGGGHIEAALHRALGAVKMQVAVVYDAQHEKHVAKFVTKRQAVAARFPTDMGGPDLHGHYTSPGTPITDAA